MHGRSRTVARFLHIVFSKIWCLKYIKRRLHHYDGMFKIKNDARPCAATRGTYKTTWYLKYVKRRRQCNLMFEIPGDARPCVFTRSRFCLDCLVFFRSLFKKYCITKKNISNNNHAHRKTKRGYFPDMVWTWLIKMKALISPKNGHPCAYGFAAGELWIMNAELWVELTHLR